MGQAWFLQANPKIYDIDAAIKKLDRIWWRAPQHASEIRVGDFAVIWRSGKSSGIVAVGRVESEPMLRPMMDGDDSTEFLLTDEDNVDGATRVLIHFVPTPFVSKEALASLSEFGEHAIVRAPMGTVFPVTSQQWDQLSPLLVSPPALSPSNESSLPAAFAWDQRTKSIHPMPGGYEQYLSSLASICDVVIESRPTTLEFEQLIEREFHVSASRAQLLASFLRKVAIVDDRGGATTLSSWTNRWLETKDDAVVIALLHRKVRFIGEMLAEIKSPQTTRKLLEIANEKYGMAWSTQAQIDRRRGWLQSAGMLTITDGNELVVSALGLETLNALSLYDAASTPVLEPRSSISVTSVDEAVVDKVDGEKTDHLANEILASAVDASNPDRFEQAVRDAFDFLGFEAQWLGGSGKTDVLLDASLGRDGAYRAIVDCKTTGSGAVSDQQVDWITLQEHKIKHEADYVVVVAPSPSGKRIHERALEQKVTLISAAQLATLCEQHRVAPLGLDDYARLFAKFGLANIDELAELAEEWLAHVGLARSVVAIVRERSVKYGPLTARDVLLVLDDDATAGIATQVRIAEVLEALSNPVIGILSGTPGAGYVARVSAATAATRLHAMAEYMVNGEA